jgi:hypothetical protein
VYVNKPTLDFSSADGEKPAQVMSVNPKLNPKLNLSELFPVWIARNQHR